MLSDERWGCVLFVAALIVVAILGTRVSFRLASIPTKSPSEEFSLPTDACEIEDLGQGWARFRLGDRRFLRHSGYGGNCYTESVVELR